LHADRLSVVIISLPPAVSKVHRKPFLHKGSDLNVNIFMRKYIPSKPMDLSFLILSTEVSNLSALQ
jgi:hypothetical protein